MTPLLSIILIVIIAYLGSAYYNKYQKSSTLVKSLGYSGSIYLIIGFLLGPSNLALITPEIMEKLIVLVALVLGWTGFLIGLQAKRSELKRFQKSYYLFSILNFLIMILASAIVAKIFITITGLKIKISYLLIFVVVSTVSSPILIGVLKNEFKLRGQIIHLLQFSVAFDNILGLLVFGIIMILNNQIVMNDILAIIVIFASIIFSILLAYLFYVLSKETKNDQQYFLILIGFLLVLVGCSLNLNMSLLFTSFIFGATLSNLPVNTKKLYHSISDAEKPLYYLMLIFVGASIAKISLYLFYLLIAFVVLRIALKYSAGFLSRYLIYPSQRPPRTIGLPHVGMGGMALAIVLDFHLSYMNETSQAILFIVAGSVIANALISSKVMRMVYIK